MERHTGRPAAVRAAAGALLVTFALMASMPASAAPPRCGGQEATIVGSDEAETIVGTDGADVIVAFAGADTVRSLRGADIVCAAAGNDRVFAGRGRDLVYGGNADDSLVGGRGRDTLYGNAGFDAIDGGLHRDRCFAGPEGASRVRCENPFSAPMPTPTPVPAPTPAPPATFQTVCQDLGGTPAGNPRKVLAGAPYVRQIGVPGYTTGPSCGFGYLTEQDWQSAARLLRPYCAESLLGEWVELVPGPNRHLYYNWLGCGMPL
jgi:hypothetical protein